MQLIILGCKIFNVDCKSAEEHVPSYQLIPGFLLSIQSGEGITVGVQNESLIFEIGSVVRDNSDVSQTILLVVV